MSVEFEFHVHSNGSLPVLATVGPSEKHVERGRDIIFDRTRTFCRTTQGIRAIRDMSKPDGALSETMRMM